LPIFVRPWLADMRHLPPKKPKTPKIPADASQNLRAPLPRSLRPHDAIRPLDSSLALSPTVLALCLPANNSIWHSDSPISISIRMFEGAKNFLWLTEIVTRIARIYFNTTAVEEADRKK